MSFTETLQSLTGKLLADCTDQELYLALLELVRQKSADRVQPVTGRKLYYISKTVATKRAQDHILNILALIICINVAKDDISSF